MLNHRRNLLHLIGSGIESTPTPKEEPPIKESTSLATSLSKISNTLEKIHIKEFNKKKKYITF